jgi:hypothetical protein
MNGVKPNSFEITYKGNLHWSVQQQEFIANYMEQLTGV